MSELPPADFINFISGLRAQALMQLGDIPHPATNEREQANLPYARYTAELLDVFQAKTVGNLTAEEDELLAGIIQEIASRLAAKEAAAGD